ncbi:putative bifunctional diguanylate cyclase/phosphodiesterase [Angustibacter sp. McL0619]|uniref:putative bifunctional diguanylate cyclase/phosphodiesterase n=1 Tax=Angustibacter sp. McL0619 TaxID=3415676 RepID=UPI003CF8819E
MRRQRRRAFDQVVRWAPWVAAVAVAAASGLASTLPFARPAAIAAFFLAVSIRAACATHSAAPGKRAPALSLTAGMVLFGLGSLVLATATDLRFPSPAEGLFASAYVCFTGFLVMDTNGRRIRDPRTVLETGVVAGGILSGALFAVVSPFSGRLDLRGTDLLVALIYPVADLALLTILLTQLATRSRARDRRSLLLLGGFITLAAVDISLPLSPGSGGYSFSTVQDLFWAVALAMLVDAVCVHRSTSTTRQSIGSVVPVASGLIALLVLIFDPAPSTWPTHIAAAATILLLLGLLLISLRDARRGAAAHILSREDDLTDLRNRRAVMEVLDSSDGESRTVVLADLNGFKAVNDSLGHQVGDRVLEQIGRRFQDIVGDAEVLARVGGDEFAIVYRDVPEDLIMARVEQLLLAMHQPMQIGERTLIVTMAVGITRTDGTTCHGTELLRRADVAMYRARSEGRGYRWYDSRTDLFSTENRHLIDDLRNGLGSGQLRAFYQPQVRASDGTLEAIEVLARWQHPTRGLLTPDQFLPVARSAGLMLPLSLEMIRLAMAQAADWVARGTPLRVSMNVDPPELLSGQWMLALFTAIEDHQLDPALITVELTEELLIHDPTIAASRIHDLADHGVEVSIDDFGTGYSGLTWLQRLPVTELKLDRSFVSRMLTDDRTHHIVESTIQLANRLGLRVVAEGVEDDATAAALTYMGAELLQGYRFSAPMTADALATWRESRLLL